MPPYQSQHYVTRSYLADFADPASRKGPALWVYERGKAGGSLRFPKSVAVKDYYYSFPGAAGDKDHSVEHLLDKTENHAMPVIRALAHGRDPASLTSEERQWLAVFLAFMSVRIPGFRNSVESSIADVMRTVGIMAASRPEYFESGLRRALKAAGKELTQDPEETRQWVLRGEYEVKTHPAVSLAMMLALTPDIAEYILNFQWRVLTAERGRFVTSDHPVVLVSTVKMPPIYGRGAGWLSPYMEATFPLAPNACLLISLHHPSGREVVSEAHVAEINLRTSAFADVAVYSSQKLEVRTLAPPPGWTGWSPVTSALRDDVAPAEDQREPSAE